MSERNGYEEKENLKASHEHKGKNKKLSCTDTDYIIQ